MATSKFITATILAASLAGCDTGTEYRLYRTWVTDETRKEPVAVFDNNDEHFDRSNCEDAARYFNQNTKGIRWWCEAHTGWGLL